MEKNNKTYRIVWRRYKHPLDVSHKYKNHSHEDEDSEAYHNDFVNESKPYSGTILYNQNGILPITPDSLPNKSYNLWVMDSNFKFPRKTIEIFNYIVEGVEGYETITPYQILIGIGRLFDEDEVKKNLEKEILDFMNETEPMNQNINMLDKVLKKHITFLDLETKVPFVIYADTETDLDNKVNKFLKDYEKEIEVVNDE